MSVGGGDRDGQRPRQKLERGSQSGRDCERGRKSGEGREAVETKKATDTPNTERDPETSAGARGAERLRRD